MNFQTHCERYLRNVQHTQGTAEATPELSLYPHLQAFLEGIAADYFDRDTVRFTQEPRRLDQIGRPDFIAMNGLLPIGYIEAEAYNRDLDALTGHAAEQNARFIGNLDNFVLTNFVEFRLYTDGQLRATANLQDDPENLETLLERFLNAGDLQIASPEVLARYLAKRTRELQTQIATTLTDEDSNIHAMFSAFKETLISTLTPDDFADMYAQTLAYGLFAARCTLPNATNFSRYTAIEALPKSNPFLVQLFYHVASPTLETNVTYILDDIASLLQNVPTEMLRTAFAARNHLEDPVIHFYETFLAEYDPQRRVDRGVYYTPSVEKLRETVTDFASLSVDEAREKYRLREDTRDWKIHFAQADLRNHPDVDRHIAPIHYRPFDTRWTYYTGKSRGFHCMPRPAIMPHLRKENFALCVCRVVASSTWQHVLITDQITENRYISNRGSESGHVFPLYLYPNPEELELETERSLNFKPAFLTALSEALGLPQVAPLNLPEDVSPEEILAYIYAILYSPTYRERYYEFLKYDFPRIPLPQDVDQFRTLAGLGQRLIDCHLLKESRPELAPTGGGVSAVHRFEGEGDGVVAQVRYSEGRVWINPSQYFTDVPLAVWEYEVGAYRVCEKWLKDRKGEALRREDLQRYRAVLGAVAETLRVMAEIDGILW